MKPTLPNLLRFLCCLLLSGSAVSAATVFINSPNHVGGPPIAVAGAKLRASQTNWDMSLDAGGGTFAGNFIQADLANNFNPPGRTFDFTLEHRAGEGFIFRAAEGSRPAVTLAWGTFSQTSFAAKVVPTINSQTPPANFNLFNLQAVADRASASTTFSNLMFSSPTVDIGGGAFQSGTVDSGTPGGITQSLIADTSLGAHNWTLSGTVTLRRPGQGGGGDETVRFVVTVANAPFLASVPEPEVVFYAMMGVALLARRGRLSVG